MKYSSQERSPHASLPEQQKYNEMERNPELLYRNEFLSGSEFVKKEEIIDNEQGIKRKKENDADRAKKLSQYISTVAVVCTAATAVVATVVSKPAVAEIGQEDIGINSYQCVLTVNGEEAGRQAVIEGTDGEIYGYIPVESEREYTVEVTDLRSDTEYSLAVVNEGGEKLFSHTFRTEPFLTLHSPEGDKIPFSLHESIPIMGDIVLRLYDEEGKDFSSAIERLYEEGTNYLYVGGLYAGKYEAEVLFFVEEQEEPIVYVQNLDLGSLVPLEFNAMQEVGYLDGTLIKISYSKGDILPYVDFEVTIESGDNWYNYDMEMITLDGNDIILNAPDIIPDGSYTISVWGSYDVGEYYIYNEIWRGNVDISRNL